MSSSESTTLFHDDFRLLLFSILMDNMLKSRVIQNSEFFVHVDALYLSENKVISVIFAHSDVSSRIQSYF